MDCDAGYSDVQQTMIGLILVSDVVCVYEVGLYGVAMAEAFSGTVMLGVDAENPQEQRHRVRLTLIASHQEPFCALCEQRWPTL